MLTVQLSPFHRLNSDRGPPIADHCSRGWSFKVVFTERKAIRTLKIVGGGLLWAVQLLR